MQGSSVSRAKALTAIAVSSIIMLGLGREARATTEPTFELNIPAQDLGSALQAFGVAVNEQVLYTPEIVVGLRSSALKGSYTSTDAVRMLLEGSGLRADPTSSDVLLIRRPSDPRVAELQPRDGSPTSDSKANGEEGKKDSPGTFRFVRVDQQMAASAAAPMSSDEDAPDQTPAKLGEIVVTGTSIESQDSPVSQSRPVDVVSAAAIQNSGVANLEDFFHTQPNFVLSGQSSYTSAGGASGGNGTNFGATNLNLRGLGSQYTLVLLNGRRFQAEDPANIDLIPVDSIERIEVLKSGASAVYGSDAVAGVVNIITKHNVNGFSVDGYYGESGQHDDSTRRASVSWGFSNDKLDVFAVGEYYSRAGLTQGQRSLSANPDLSRFNSGFNYQVFPYSSLAQVTLPDGTGPLVLNQSAFGCGGYSRNPADYVPLNSHQYATGCDATLDEDKRSLITAQRKGSFFASLDYKLPHETTFYSDFDFSRSITDNTGILYGADGFGDPNSSFDLSPIPASNYWNPFGVDIEDVSYGLPEAGPQVDDVGSNTWRLNLGVKGALGVVHYDVGGSYFYNYANDVKGPYPTSAGLYAAEQRPGAAAVNLFCNACNTPAQLAGIFAMTNVKDWEEAALFNAHAYAPVFTLPAGDINLAAGAEYQRDTYIVQQASALQDASLYDVLALPVSAGRRYTSVYVEGQLPIFGKSMTLPGLASLGVDVAARYENIQEAGSRTDPTVSVRWEPVANWLALRYSYGTSFRAPPLTAAYAPTALLGATPLINPATGQYANYDEIVGGNRNLKPETATYTTYGIVLTPQFAPGLSLQLDRWIINQKNIVIQTSAQEVLDGVQPGGTFTAADGTTGVYSLYMNAAGQRVNGVDLDLDYRFRTASVGVFDFRLSGTYLNSFQVNDENGSGYVQYAGGTALASSLPTVTGLPKYRSLFATNWAYGAFSLTYLMHYSSSYVDPTIPGGVEVGHYTTHDIQFNCDLGRLMQPASWLSSLKLSVGATNFTYAKVPIFYATVSPTQSTFANGYDTSIVDPVGRFFYARLRLDIPQR